MSSSLFRFVGSLATLDRQHEVRRQLIERAVSSDGQSVRAATASIVDRVRRQGDDALRALARDLDGVSLDSLEVPRAALTRALDGLDTRLRTALERAAANIMCAHQAFVPVAVEIATEPGVVVGRRPDPLDAVGVYAPGGRGAYPSSVLMGVVPAKVARVPSVILCSPPDRDGVPSRIVLAAAEIAGADRVFALGGAGAIAAMAYGTASVPRVSRIVGPGNAYVAEAKLQVQASGTVAIDSPAGPSELLVIADASADAGAVARELLAQAEHDPMTSVVLLANEERIAGEVVRLIGSILPTMRRESIIAEALKDRSAIIWSESMDDLIALAAEYAPEHLLLAGARAETIFGDIRNAGTVFIGQHSSVAYGDYMTGANHVLPTGGTARSYSGLSTSDFMRWTTYQRISRSAAAKLASDVALIAESEQLDGHARAARAWETIA